MLSFYLVCGIVGFVLIALTALGALHHDAGDGGELVSDHAGSDVPHHDSGVGLDHDNPLLIFISLRFWMYFFAVGGIIGSLLTIFQLAPATTTAAYSSASGFLTGLIVMLTVRWARGNEATSSVSERDFMGAWGRLLVGTREGLPGKVRLEMKGESIDLIAIGESGQTIEAGEQVTVVAVEGNKALVMRKDDLLS